MYLKWFKTQEEYFYFAFRIVFGLLFAMHGLSKLGATGKPAMTGLMLVVGIGELLVGLGLVTGLFTRLAAAGGIVIMLGAWFKVHATTNWNPMTNGGELVLLFLFGFLLILALGYKKWGLDGLFKKEVF